MLEALEPIVLPVHTASTLALCGLIWTVQIVHYPLMAWVGRDSFAAWHERHLRWMTWVVGPFMLAEVASSLWLLDSPERRAAASQGITIGCSEPAPCNAACLLRKSGTTCLLSTFYATM